MNSLVLDCVPGLSSGPGGENHSGSRADQGTDDQSGDKATGFTPNLHFHCSSVRVFLDPRTAGLPAQDPDYGGQGQADAAKQEDNTNKL